MHLPDPLERPNTCVVIWDGRCSFCRSQVERLRRFDFRNQLSYLSLHDSRIAELVPDLTYEQLMEQMWIVTPEGDKFGGADAGRYLSRHLPGLWWLALPLHIPFSMPLWRRVYRSFAQRRYRLGGGECDEEGTCEIHRR